VGCCRRIPCTSNVEKVGEEVDSGGRKESFLRDHQGERKILKFSGAQTRKEENGPRSKKPKQGKKTHSGREMSGRLKRTEGIMSFRTGGKNTLLRRPQRGKKGGRGVPQMATLHHRGPRTYWRQEGPTVRGESGKPRHENKKQAQGAEGEPSIPEAEKSAAKSRRTRPRWVRSYSPETEKSSN